MPPRPRYHPDDSRHLLTSGGPSLCLQLSDGRLAGLLQSMRATGQAYAQCLAQCPHVLCEPLDLFYRCRQGMGSLDDDLLHDLLVCYSWREANWGAWLAALAPDRRHAAHLRRRATQLPHGTQVIDLALASCGEPVSPAIAGIWPVFTDVLAQLRQLPVMAFPMRRALTVEQEARLAFEQDQLRRVYRQGGTEAAHRNLRDGVLGYVNQTRAEWLASGAPPCPDLQPRP